MLLLFFYISLLPVSSGICTSLCSSLLITPLQRTKPTSQNSRATLWFTLRNQLKTRYWTASGWSRKQRWLLLLLVTFRSLDFLPSCQNMVSNTISDVRSCRPAGDPHPSTTPISHFWSVRVHSFGNNRHCRCGAKLPGASCTGVPNFPGIDIASTSAPWAWASSGYDNQYLADKSLATKDFRWVSILATLFLGMLLWHIAT